MAYAFWERFAIGFWKIFKNFLEKLILKKYWERAEYILTDPLEIYNQIARDPEKKKILDTDRGRKWLTYVRKRCYDFYYDYTWN